MGRLKFEEQARCKMRGNRNLVVSKAINEEGKAVGYSVAECVVTEHEGNKEDMFLKCSGLGILSRENLEEIVSCIQGVLEKK